MMSNIAISGESLCYPSLPFNPMGLSMIGPSFAGIRLNGSAPFVRNLSEGMSGGATTAGEAQCSASSFSHVVVGGITILGQSFIQSPSWSISTGGEIILAGESVPLFALDWQSNPYPVSLSGFVEYDYSLVYGSIGGVALSGVALIQSQWYTHSALGGLSLLGEAIAVNSNLGEFGIEIGSSSTVLSVGIGFRDDTSISPPQPTDELVIVDCNCDPTPPQLEFAHNLGDGGILSEFLFRNSLVFPGTITLNYNEIIRGWQGNYHLRGQSVDSDLPEWWNFIVEWCCDTSIAGYDFSSRIWRFGLSVKKTRANVSRDMRMVLGVSQTGACTNGLIDYRFQINTSTLEATTTPTNTLNELTINDTMGLFRGLYWERRPNFVGSIGVRKSPPSFTRLDSGVVYPPSQAFPER